LPFSYGYFKESVQKALEMAPRKVENSYSLIKNLAQKEYLLDYPTALTSLLIFLISLDKNLIWSKDELEKIWNALRYTDSENTDKLTEELARIGILE